VQLLVLPGDGIGPEITRSTVDVIQLVDRRFELGFAFEHREIGFASLRREGTTLPAAVLDSARAADGVILGPASNADYPPPDQGGIGISATFRGSLDLYANIRPSRSYEGLPHWGRTAMDLVIVRENTEGFYADRNMFLGSGEFMPTPDLALSVRKISASSCRRIARTAFELARQRRKKVTAVHKGNVLKVSEGLFLREVRSVAADFPDVVYAEQLVDSMAALLVRCPDQFDVIVTTNMFGDILSDEAAELSGSLGLGAALNCSDRHAIAQAAHGSAPDIAGRDRANPISLILSAAMLLEWLAKRDHNDRLLSASRLISTSVATLLRDPARRTYDLGGALGTRAFTAALCNEIRGAKSE
jgi:3-isopropylmalate dehydrogenase